MKPVVLITGTSSGIGKAAVIAFASKGWNVAATLRNPAKEHSFDGLPDVKLFALDVTDNNSINNAFEQALQAFGRIDVVVNNAGYGLDGVFEAIPEEAITRQFDTNVFGLMRVTRAAIALMRKQGGGTIVQISSMGGRVSFPLYSIYHATKWAVEGFTEALHYELEHLNIRLKLVEPGFIATEFAGRSRETVRPAAINDYNDYLDKFDKAFAKAEQQGGEQPSIVAGMIVKAAGDKSKKLRYPVGKPSPLMMWLQKLPDSWRFAMTKRAIGM